MQKCLHERTKSRVVSSAAESEESTRGVNGRSIPSGISVRSGVRKVGERGGTNDDDCARSCEPRSRVLIRDVQLTNACRSVTPSAVSSRVMIAFVARATQYHAVRKLESDARASASRSAPVAARCDQRVNYTDQGTHRVGCILGNWELAGIVALPLHRHHASVYVCVRETHVVGRIVEDGMKTRHRIAPFRQTSSCIKCT